MKLRRLMLLVLFASVALTCVAAEKPKGATKPAPSITPATIPAALPAHPRLLLRKDDLREIRQRAETTEWGRSELNKIRRNAERWLTNQITLPERGGQWPHHYVCTKDGGRLKTQSPTQHVCPLCKEVYTGWPYDDVVLGSKHSALAEALRDCGLMYQLSGERRFASKGKEILLSYAEKYQSYPLHNIRGQAAVGGAKMSAQTLDEAMLLIPMAQGADMIWETLSTEEQRQAADGLFRPAAEVIRKHRMGVHNIQCWKNSAVGIVGLLLGDQELIADAINQPTYGYLTQMAQGVQRDGVWYEGAWGYHFFTIGAIWPLTEAARHCGIDLYGRAFRSMFEAPLNLAMPNLTLPAFNDSTEVNLKGSSVYELALARYGEAQFARPLAAGKRGSLLALVLGRRELPAIATGQLGSQNFTNSGYAVLRSGADANATWLALKYGPHGGGHGHPDKLNFVLAARGHVVAYDPGTVLYAAPLHKEWDTVTVAHNTLTVDEKSQAHTEGKTLAFVSEPGVSAALADAGPIYAGLQFRRGIALFGDDLVLVFDRVTADREHTFDLAYHSRGAYVTKPAGAAWTSPKAPGYMHFKDAAAVAQRNEFSVAIKIGKDLPTRFTALSQDPAEFIAGTGVDRNVRTRAPMILVRNKGRELTVGWAVSLGEASASAPKLSFVSEGGKAVGVEARAGARTARLVCRPEKTKAAERIEVRRD